MSYSCGYGVYNLKKQLIRSFDNYCDALSYIKTLKGINSVDVHYLFESKPIKVYFYSIVYIQKYFESGGGVYQYGSKYYYNKE